MAKNVKAIQQKESSVGKQPTPAQAAEAAHLFSKARAQCILDAPWFGALALRLKEVQDISCPTAWTNGESFGYNPLWWLSLTDPQRKGIVAHEVMHCACKHQTRRKHRNHRKWNRACDWVINAILIECKFELPEEGLIDPQWKDFCAEEVYARIPDDPNDEPGKDGGEGSDPGGCGEVRDAPVQSDAECTAHEQEWDIAAKQATNAAKAMGKLPAGLKRFVDEMLEPQVDWRSRLRNVIQHSFGMDDYTWRRPNRLYEDVYIPSTQSERVGPLVFVTDTSGSMGTEEFKAAVGELNSILSDVKPEWVLYIPCDATVYTKHIQTYTPEDLPIVTVDMSGGGGTSFKPPFKYLEKQGIEPQCLIYLTDMCGDFPSEAPSYDVVWLNTYEKDTKAPFGETLWINLGK